MRCGLEARKKSRALKKPSAVSEGLFLSLNKFEFAQVRSVFDIPAYRHVRHAGTHVLQAGAGTSTVFGTILQVVTETCFST